MHVCNGRYRLGLLHKRIWSPGHSAKLIYKRRQRSILAAANERRFVSDQLFSESSRCRKCDLDRCPTGNRSRDEAGLIHGLEEAFEITICFPPAVRSPALK